MRWSSLVAAERERVSKLGQKKSYLLFEGQVHDLVDVCGALRGQQQSISKKLSILTNGELGTCELSQFLTKKSTTTENGEEQNTFFAILCNILDDTHNNGGEDVQDVNEDVGGHKKPSKNKNYSLQWIDDEGNNEENKDEKDHEKINENKVENQDNNSTFRMGKPVLRKIVETLNMVTNEEKTAVVSKEAVTTQTPSNVSFNRRRMSSIMNLKQEDEDDDFDDEWNHESIIIDEFVNYLLIRFDSRGSGESLDLDGFKKLLEFHSRKIVGASLEHLIGTLEHDGDKQNIFHAFMEGSSLSQVQTHSCLAKSSPSSSSLSVSSSISLCSPETISSPLTSPCPSSFQQRMSRSLIKASSSISIDLLSPKKSRNYFQSFDDPIIDQSTPSKNESKSPTQTTPKQRRWSSFFSYVVRKQK
mmetsp:Transcript_447/g.565  ORF Transcript_447/g.565 Transcript_447/m.565 type:complete len:416 (+) Transcript_447:150-1397(+)